MEIIRVVERSALSVRRTLRELDVTPSSFYTWYGKYLEDGYDGLANNHKSPKQFWNAIPAWEKERVVQVARNYPEKSCREIACHIVDNFGYFISESGVYRIFKAENLISSPVYTVISAMDKFDNPAERIKQLWQTDFTYFKIVHWGWYYRLTILDDFSRNTAKTIADVYKSRWDIELFFKWIKQNLKIKTFIGTSENAVKIQKWTAMIAFLLTEYIRFKSRTSFPILKTFTILSENILFPSEIFQLLKKKNHHPIAVEKVWVIYSWIWSSKISGTAVTAFIV